MFKSYIQRKELPSKQEIEKLTTGNVPLQNRTPEQIKSWISNQQKNVSTYQRQWSSEEKRVCREAFSSYMNGAGYPSRNEIQEACKKFPALKTKSVEKIKSFVQQNKKRVLALETV